MDERKRHTVQALISLLKDLHMNIALLLHLLYVRNMLMTINIKLSIIVIAEIIPSTDDTCLHQSISPQNGPSKVNCASILPVVSTIIATVCRTLRHNYKSLP